jgi:hypothetical protein
LPLGLAHLIASIFSYPPLPFLSFFLSPLIFHLPLTVIAAFGTFTLDSEVNVRVSVGQTVAHLLEGVGRLHFEQVEEDLGAVGGVGVVKDCALLVGCQQTVLAHQWYHVRRVDLGHEQVTYFTSLAGRLAGDWRGRLAGWRGRLAGEAGGGD